MNSFDDFVSKLNFKKVVVTYLIVSVIVGILLAGFLVYAAQDKLNFMYEYHKIREKVKDNDIVLESLKTELNNLANISSDMVDIIILNRQNQIQFSAKNSELSKNKALELTSGIGMRRCFLTDRRNPDVYFRMIKGDKLALSLFALGIENEVEQEYEERYFHESNFDTKKVYLLSYIIDKSSGDKIYFISDIHPVAGGRLYIKAVAVTVMLFFMLYWVLLALWVYTQALKSKLNPSMWGIITLFTNLAGLFVFLIYKQGNQSCYKCGALQSKSNIYCTFCGAKLGFVCKECNMEVTVKDNYCRNCGNMLNKDKKQDE